MPVIRTNANRMYTNKTNTTTNSPTTKIVSTKDAENRRQKNGTGLRHRDDTPNPIDVPIGFARSPRIQREVCDGTFHFSV